MSTDNTPVLTMSMPCVPAIIPIPGPPVMTMSSVPLDGCMLLMVATRKGIQSSDTAAEQVMGPVRSMPEKDNAVLLTQLIALSQSKGGGGGVVISTVVDVSVVVESVVAVPDSVVEAGAVVIVDAVVSDAEAVVAVPGGAVVSDTEAIVSVPGGAVVSDTEANVSVPGGAVVSDTEAIVVVPSGTVVSVVVLSGNCVVVAVGGNVVTSGALST